MGSSFKKLGERQIWQGHVVSVAIGEFGGRKNVQRITDAAERVFHRVDRFWAVFQDLASGESSDIETGGSAVVADAVADD